MKQRSLPSIITGALLVVILGLYMITYQVRFNEVAVIRTFGRITEPDPVTGTSPDVKTEPGLYWKWPWPIQRVEHYDNRLQVTETTGEEIPTADKRNVIVTTAIGWRIDDPYWFNIRNLGGMKGAEESLKTLVRSYQKTVIGNHELAGFVSLDTEKIQYDEMEEQILKDVAPKAKELHAIRLEYIGIEKLALPAKITENVFSAMKEERNAEAARFTSEGEAKAEQIKGEAENIADTILSFARLRADEIVAEGMRRAAEHNVTFSQDEELASFLWEMDLLGTILKDRTTIILDGLQSPLNIIGEALKSTAQGGPTPGAKMNATGPAVSVPVPETGEPQ